MATEDPRSGPSLNPFVIPSETEARFTLLIVAALLLAFWIGFHLVLNLSDEQALLLAGRYPQADTLFANLSYDNILDEEGNRLLVFARQKLTFLAFPIGLMIALVGLTSIIYFQHPHRIRRKSPVKPFTQETAPKLYLVAQELLGSANLRNPPEVELGISLREASGQAYGFAERSFLRLDNGLARLLIRMRNYVDAVILHELAHVVNGDVSRYHFASAIWNATAILAFIPFILWQGFYLIRNLFFGGEGSLGLNFFFILQVTAVMASIRAIQAGLARIREHYADWRAALWCGREAVEQSLTGGKSSTVPIWKLPWLFHPTASERVATLRDSMRLFRLRPDLPVIVGFVSALAMNSVTILSLFGGLFLSSFTEFLSLKLAANAPRLAGDLLSVGQLLVGIFLLLPTLGIALLISRTLGLQIQRQSIADQNTGRSGIVEYLRLLFPAGLLLLGFEVGFLVTPFPLLSSFINILLSDPISFRPLAYIVLHLVAGVLLATVLALMRFFTERLLCSHSGIYPPESIRRRFNLLLTAILWSILVSFTVGRELLRTGSTLYGALTVPLLALPLLLGLMALGATFVVILMRGRPRSLRCPHCGQLNHASVAIGQVCSKCNQLLAPWAYVPES